MKPSDKIIDFLVKDEIKKWVDGNPTFIEDIQNLIHEMQMFEVKYGQKILYEFKKQD